MSIRIVEEISDERIRGRADVAPLERRLAGRLPEDYLRFLVETNGGRPDSAAFIFEDTRGERADSLIDWFFGICDDEVYGIGSNLDAYEGRLADEFCPIACDPFGNLLLIGVGSSNRGHIYFWDHELEGSNSMMSNMSRVASSFSDFIALLK